jgi:hypothetical protein
MKCRKIPDSVYKEFQPDATTHLAFPSGRANEIAQSKMIDWPGRPGTKVPDFSTYQVQEFEYMFQEEYPEFINDFTDLCFGNIFQGHFRLKRLSGIQFVPSIVLNTTPLGTLYSPEALEAYKLLAEIGEEDKKAAEASNVVANELVGMGFPPFMTGAGEYHLTL